MHLSRRWEELLQQPFFMSLKLIYLLALGCDKVVDGCETVCNSLLL